jgi:dienelactone hydrolase
MERDWKLLMRSRTGVLLMLAVIWAAVLPGPPVLAQCTPFGNPPQTLLADIKPKCSGGTLLGPWQDSDGTARYACLYQPSQASAKAPLPLVVYVHPSETNADSISVTNLVSLIKTANLNDNPARPGFILLAPEGRNITHLFGPPGTTDSQGPGWDNWYRQLAPAGATIDGTSYPENVDAATIDQFIAQEVATGQVDTNRIFLTGWSNGSSMAFLYGLSRPNIAALAPYSGPNPFGYLLDPCYQTPVTGVPADNTELTISNPTLPINHVHNSCDIAGSCPNAEWLIAQLLPLGTFVQDTLISSSQAPANGCDLTCGNSFFGSAGTVQGEENHVRWPTDWNLAMLDFFRRHPLNGRPQ